MLLVDHDQAQALKRHGLLNQGMGSDHDPHRAGRELLADGLLVAGAETADEKPRGDAQGLEQARQRGEMLFREQFRGRHQRRLVVIFDGKQHGEQSDDRLAGADVPHQ